MLTLVKKKFLQIDESLNFSDFCPFRHFFPETEDRIGSSVHLHVFSLRLSFDRVLDKQN